MKKYFIGHKPIQKEENLGDDKINLPKHTEPTDVQPRPVDIFRDDAAAANGEGGEAGQILVARPDGTLYWRDMTEAERLEYERQLMTPSCECGCEGGDDV